MSSFETFPEQAEAKRLLRAALADGPAHAYLLHGPRGVGKRENLPDGVRFHEADIRNGTTEVFDEARPEVCFHLAAQADVRVSVERPDYDADVNVVGTIRVLEELDV